MKQELIRNLEAESKNLQEIIRRSGERLKKAPEGSIRRSIQHGNSFYYHCFSDGENEQRTYIRKEDSELAERLMQKQYDRKILQAAEEQKKAIERFLKKYDPEALKNLYKELPQDQRSFIQTDVIDNRTFAERWRAVVYLPGEFQEGAPEYYTIRRERVRSKSEKIIADMLHTKDIPYMYEYPYKLNNGKIWRPDFRILNVRTRKEYIHEHFGMMDHPALFSMITGALRSSGRRRPAHWRR
ncbi:MAG: hypothetical protein IJ106_07130 [Parasporobacterium sp.]|nr:hypothetical protein [Parasporobacterium sp.]